MTKTLPLTCLLSVLIVMTWSAYHPHDTLTWFLESFPVLIALPLLLFTYKKFRLTNLLYGLIAFHCIILLIGAHYTYALVPLFNDLRDAYDLDRNYYDRVGHFVQGFVPAMIGRELLLRFFVVKRGAWLFVILVLICLGVSAIYEEIEFLAAMLSGEAADAFLGTQGDNWDTQKDMLLAGIGAALALLTLSRWHDRDLRRIT